MRAALIDSWRDPATLTVVEVPSPTPGPGQVRLRVRAAGVNFADALIVQGQYQEKPAFPFAPGFEVAGEVAEVGPGVTSVVPGQAVFAVLDHGGYAEEALARAEDVHPLAAGMDFATGAAFPIAYGTSHFALMDRGRLRAGETLLVHGAAGGVGLTAVECGKAAGATVIATAGGADKLAVAADHGADHGIDSRTEDLRARVKALTGGRGVDVVYDPVGGDLFEASLRCTAPDGRLLIIGFASGQVPPVRLNHVMVKNLSLIGVYWSAYRRLAPARVGASFDQLRAWFEAGKLHPLVSHTVPLAEAAEALMALKDRKVTGKAVLLCG
jgi:NADPH2:quinone reductase